MRYEMELLVLPAGILLLAIFFHFAYLNRIKSRISMTVDSKVRMNDLKRALQTPQGSSFNTLLLSSWSLFFVALVFLYFLTPTIFPRLNYFQIPVVASAEFGLIILGVAVIALTGLLAFGITQIYGYYAVSGSLKTVIIYLAPLLLIISISISIYLATVYPMTNKNSWNLGYLTLVASQILLLLPVFSGFMGDIK
jgi:hypothetical protein